jgi:hypothetical protein
MRRIRPHLSFANVASAIALFVAISGGTAVALSGSNTVFTDDIVDNEVRSADVRNDSLSAGGLAAADLRPSSVGTSEIATESVDTFDVKNGSLTGADINESLLQTVPNADKLDGVDSTELQRVGLVDFGRGGEGEGLTFLRWDELGAAFRSSEPGGDPNAVILRNVHPTETVHFRYDATQVDLAPGQFSTEVDISDMTTFLVWNADNDRSWLVVCARVNPDPDIQVRCHGVRSRTE